MLLSEEQPEQFPHAPQPGFFEINEWSKNGATRRPPKSSGPWLWETMEKAGEHGDNPWFLWEFDITIWYFLDILDTLIYIDKA